MSLAPPEDINRPFFAYGLFRPGQLAFFQLRDLIAAPSVSASIPGQLRLRDGLPILQLSKHGSVHGAVLSFREGMANTAYQRISEMEPEKQYRWDKVRVEQQTANVLVGKSPDRSELFEGDDWNGWDDPLFGAALEVVVEVLESLRQSSIGI